MSPPTSPTELRPAAPNSFEDGPVIAPSAALLKWLAANGGTPTGSAPRPRLRVPVVVRFGDEHRLEISDAWIGFDTGAAAPRGAVHLELDDTALGVALIDTARHLCPADAPGCGLELEGVWGRIVELPIPLPKVPGPKRWPFGITRAGGLLKAADAPAKPRIGVAR